MTLVDFDLLFEYAELEGCELGEAIEILLDFRPFLDYLSDEFKQAYIDEIKYQLQWFKDNTKIVEVEYELPPIIKYKTIAVEEERQFRIQKELVFLDDETK